MKKIILLCMIILLTGCQADYTLYINKDKSINETLIIQDSKEHFLEIDSDIQKIIQNKVDIITPMLENSIFDYDIFVNKNSAGIKYKNNYISYNDLNQSNYLKAINANVEVMYDEATTLYIYNNFDYLIFLEETEYDPISLENINVHINIPFEVLESNADNVTGTTYTWKINDNAQNRTLYIKFNENKIVRKTSWNDTLLAFIVISVIILTLGITVLVVWRINKKNNKI